MISRLDRIPQEGEETEVSILGYCFKILRVENKIIHTIRVRKEQPEEDHEEEQELRKKDAHEDFSDVKM